MLVFTFMLKQDVDGNMFFSVTSSALMYVIFCLESLGTSLDIVSLLSKGPKYIY